MYKEKGEINKMNLNKTNNVVNALRSTFNIILQSNKFKVVGFWTTHL